MDYQGNAKKDKSEKQQPRAEKKLAKVVTGEVVVKKKSLGRKFKDVFVEADFRSVVRYVISDVLIPAARNMIVDSTQRGVERLVYGDKAVQRRSFGSAGRISYQSYQTPVSRSYSSPASRMAPAIGSSRASRDDVILADREEAELVLERMGDVIDQFEIVTMADLNELLGLPTSHVDYKWGWMDIRGVRILQVREGYLIDLPPADPIQ